ncbi:hypothetical protein [Aliarcobacter butzleri]|uniref:hypothetical protein n=1 Tax=Aliarcobacter butzleri TaxID=28197 RepID=UPI00214AFD47|nr:hypothetical protein [Aliarcobacter butzleri]MCP3649696.1 hypothetical protein [Arcobacter sp. DNRA7]MCR1815869.1 hypothetical protein [Aliarcobacter butzleri]
MKKIFILILLKISLFSYNDEDIKYYIDYEEYGQIKTKIIVKQHYDYIKENLETLEKNQKIIWEYDNKKYEIVEVYNNIKKLEELDKQKTETQLKKEDEEKKSIEEQKQKETNKNIITLIIVLLIIYFLYKKLKNRKTEMKEIYIQKEEKKEIEKVKKTVRIEEKKEVIKTEIKEEQKTENLLNYEELEKMRVLLFKKVKYDKQSSQTRKKELYDLINNLKIEILKKENLEEINKKINELNEELKNG